MKSLTEFSPYQKGYLDAIAQFKPVDQILQENIVAMRSMIEQQQKEIAELRKYNANFS